MKLRNLKTKSYIVMKRHFCAHLFLAWARFRSLRSVDTRIFDVYASTKMFAWSVGFWGFEHYDDNTVYGRLDNFTPGWLVAIMLVPLSLALFGSVLCEAARLRRFTLGVSFFWWAWLTAIMAQQPPGWAALITYSFLAVFCAFSFLAARYRGEVLK